MSIFSKFREFKESLRLKNETKRQLSAARELEIERLQKDGTLWTAQGFPVGHPAHIPTIDRQSQIVV